MPLRGFHTPGPLRFALVLALLASPAACAAPRQDAARPAAPVPLPMPALEADGFLPDTTVLARVDHRLIHAKGLADSWRNMNPEYRPASDSAGRVRMLQNMIDKEVLALTATGRNVPLSFEDRVTLRQYSDQVYANTLYQRAVMDSVVVTPEEIDRHYAYLSERLRLRRVQLTDRPTAERVRSELASGRITWADAARRYSTAEDRESGGELGWTDSPTLGVKLSDQIYPLKVGEVSPVIEVPGAYEVVQIAERQSVPAPARIGIEALVRDRLASARAEERAERIQGQMAAEIGLVVDSVNTAFAAAGFSEAVRTRAEGTGTVIDVDAAMPEFAPADTGRTLARWNGGRLSLDGFLDAYSHISPIMRPNVNDYWLMRRQIISTVLEPYMTELALRRGIDKDPMAMRLVQLRQEELMVERLYQDSVATRVWVRPEDRRRYYEEHKADYVTFVRVTYGALHRPTRAGIDSVAARLDRGERLPEILRADSLAGLTSGSIQERSEAERGSQYYRELFEELRPGQWRTFGPDREGHYLLIQVLHREESRQLSFEEAQQYVDESVQNLKAEEALKAFLERRRQAYRIDSRPDLVMRVRWP